MAGILSRYARWLHTGWPAGTVEKLPRVDADGRTNVPGLYVTGDLTGIPLLKFALDGGARAARAVAAELGERRAPDGTLDLAVIGAGVSGMAAAMEARRLGLSVTVFESAEPFFTVANFPVQKPIYTYPREMTPAGALQVRADVKEDLLRELREQTEGAGIEVRPARIERVKREGDGFLLEAAEGGPYRARRVIAAIGQNGDYRRLGVPGEDRDTVSNRLHDPKDFAGKRVMVVGGGDSALEAAIALAGAGARVTLCYRGEGFARPKPENTEGVRRLAGAGALEVRFRTRVKEIGDSWVAVTGPEGDRTLPNDAMFVMIGREAPLDFFRRSGVAIRGERGIGSWIGLAAILLAAVFVYHWKTSAGIPIYEWFKDRHWFPFNLAATASPSSLWGTVQLSMLSPSFYYSLVYCLVVAAFGYRRIRRRRTPYVTAQTLTLTAVQVLPLFLLPYVLLPWAGHNGWFDAGLGRRLADAFFPVTQWDPQGREYWRSVGFILAWPLMFWNVFTDQPMGAWLAVSAMQTLVIIPVLVFVWGKGAYCGWICSCGALAETAGDTVRRKMPHGPRWNRLNLAGQVILAAAVLLLVLRIASWLAPSGSAFHRAFTAAYMAGFLGKTASWGNLPFPFTFLNYDWIVDLTLAGIVGVGLYVHFSGRVWCRFFCPLAALMHVYARFSRFRIFADKKKCISCNVCTSVCHQGIDVMSFANKGEPMKDPECVRCSACVQSCPTGVLSFGRVDAAGEVAATDRLAASPVRMRENE